MWATEVSATPISQQLKGSLGQMGIERLTVIQSKCMAPILDTDCDVLIKSETGSGKTLAYGLPLIEKMTRASLVDRIQRDDGSRIIILTPTRELASQIQTVLQKLCKPYPFIVIGSIMGGENKKKEKGRLRKGLTVLVATPGRLLDHLQNTQSFSALHLTTIVFDEADRLLDMGFEKDIGQIHSILKEYKQAAGAPTPTFRCVLASATLDKKVQRLAHVTLANPIFVAANDKPMPSGESTEEGGAGEGDELDNVTIPEGLKQFYISCRTKDRTAALLAFLMWKTNERQKDGSTNRNKFILFTTCCDAVEFLYSILSAVKHPSAANAAPLDANEDVDYEAMDEDVSKLMDKSIGLNGGKPLLETNIFKLHGNVGQHDRLSIYHSFLKAENGILICTDVAARGLDLPNVNWIIQFDPPGPERVYVHRVGRTARIGKSGNSVMFLAPEELGYLELLSPLGIEAKRLKFDLVLFHAANRVLHTNNVLNALHLLQKQIAACVMGSSEFRRLAQSAYNSFVRAYSTQTKRLRTIFNKDNLHLGHLLHSFGITTTMGEIFGKTAEKRKREDLLEAKYGERELKKRKIGTGKQRERRQSASATPEYKPSVLVKAAKKRKDFEAEARAKRPAKRKAPTEFDA